MSERVAAPVELGEGETFVAHEHRVAVTEALCGALEPGVHHDDVASAAARSRKTSFMTLPVAFNGNSSRSSIARGTL